MTTDEIHVKLKARIGDGMGPLSEPRVDRSCLVKAERLLEACRWLKHEPGVELDFCQDLTAVDWPKRNVIEVVYHLFSYRHRHGIVLKVEADRANPVVPSVEGVWKAANFMEREVYDLFGVSFPGHPDLRRVLLPDDWVGHPLRKDWQDPEYYNGMHVKPTPQMAERALAGEAIGVGPFDFTPPNAHVEEE